MERTAPFAGRCVLTHVAERSVLASPAARDLVPFEVAGRRRLATCSGASWFRGHHLAVVNLYGGHLRVHRFEPGDGVPPRLVLLHETSDGISHPEDVSVSPDGARVAVTHSLSPAHGLSVHAIDPRSLAPSPGALRRRGTTFHGVAFAPDSRHVAFTEVGVPGYVELFDATRADAAPAQRLVNEDASMKPKSVAFSRDGRYLAIVKSPNVDRTTPRVARAGRLAVHAFDARVPSIDPRPLAELAHDGELLGNAESCAFLPPRDGVHPILVTDQGRDVVDSFVFDPARRTLAPSGRFASGLPFVHGIDADAGGCHVAVTTYGDDAVRVFEVPSGASCVTR